MPAKKWEYNFQILFPLKTVENYIFLPHILEVRTPKKIPNISFQNSIPFVFLVNQTEDTKKNDVLPPKKKKHSPAVSEDYDLEKHTPPRSH